MSTKTLAACALLAVSVSAGLAGDWNRLKDADTDAKLRVVKCLAPAIIKGNMDHWYNSFDEQEPVSHRHETRRLATRFKSKDGSMPLPRLFDIPHHVDLRVLSGEGDANDRNFFVKANLSCNDGQPNYVGLDMSLWALGEVVTNGETKAVEPGPPRREMTWDEMFDTPMSAAGTTFTSSTEWTVAPQSPHDQPLLIGKAPKFDTKFLIWDAMWSEKNYRYGFIATPRDIIELVRELAVDP